MPHVAPYSSFPPLNSVAEGARIFVLTGGGISAESGIRTFRDAGGLWEQYRFEEVASPEGWQAHPEVVWRFYGQRRAQAATCEPNAAHRALAALERRAGERLFLCTQNVDDLHEKAGSTRVHHMHGELFKSRCESCARPPFEDRVGPRRRSRAATAATASARTSCGSARCPWHGRASRGRSHACDVFVVIGSSGAVYPAAGFVCRREGRARDGVRRPRGAGQRRASSTSAASGGRRRWCRGSSGSLVE